MAAKTRTKGMEKLLSLFLEFVSHISISIRKLNPNIMDELMIILEQSCFIGLNLQILHSAIIALTFSKSSINFCRKP